MISKEEMIPLLLEACPAFGPRWEEHLIYWRDKSPAFYIDIEEFFAFLLDSHKRGQIECVQVAFDVLERFLVEGDWDTQELATVGFIEDVQNASSWEPLGAIPFIPFLKPHSYDAWKKVDAMWEGISSLPDMIRAEQAGRK